MIARLVLRPGHQTSIREVAGALCGLIHANLAALQEGLIVTPEELKALRYIDQEKPDRWCVLSVILDEGRADCEDLMAAWAAFFISTRGAARVSAWVTYGGPRLFHTYLRVDGVVFDPAVDAGMVRPPSRIYSDPRAVEIPIFCKGV